MFKILKSFFCNGNGEFVPPYFWITTLMILVVTMFSMRIFFNNNFSDMLILGVLGLVIGWCAVYNVRKDKKRSITTKRKKKK